MTFWQWWFQAWQIWTGCESESNIDQLFHLIREIEEGERGAVAEAGWRGQRVGWGWWRVDDHFRQCILNILSKTVLRLPVSTLME